MLGIALASQNIGGCPEGIVFCGGMRKDRERGSAWKLHTAILKTFQSLRVTGSFHPWSLLWKWIYQQVPHASQISFLCVCLCARCLHKGPASDTLLMASPAKWATQIRPHGQGRSLMSRLDSEPCVRTDACPGVCRHSPGVETGAVKSLVFIITSSRPSVFWNPL